ncbi:hypothetical protein [Rhodanobacter sp. L36]|nr:hypothetical protein [Rhodanobacter sp. L36]
MIPPVAAISAITGMAVFFPQLVGLVETMAASVEGHGARHLLRDFEASRS